MRTDDFRINAKVRSILVRHWIDTTRCNFGTIKGKVFIRGTIKRIFGQASRHPEGMDKEIEEREADKQLTSELAVIQQLEEEIRRIPDVVSVHFDLERWKKERGAWRRKVM